MAMVGRACTNGYGRADLIFFVNFFINLSRKNREKKNKQMLAQKCKSFANKTLNRMKSILNYSAKKKLK